MMPPPGFMPPPFPGMPPPELMAAFMAGMAHAGGSVAPGGGGGAGGGRGGAYGGMGGATAEPPGKKFVKRDPDRDTVWKHDMFDKKDAAPVRRMPKASAMAAAGFMARTARASAPQADGPATL